MSDLDRLLKLSGMNAQSQTQETDDRKFKEAVGEFAEPIYQLCDEIGCDTDHPIFAELVRYMSGDQIKDFVADYRRHHDMNDVNVIDDDDPRYADDENLPKDESVEPTEPSKEEGNEFSGELAKAKAAGKKEFEVDGKKYKVKEDEVEEEAVEENDNWVEEANRIKELAGIKTIEEAPADDCDCEVHEEHSDCTPECCDETPVAEAPAEAPVEASVEEDAKTIPVNKLIPLAGDSIWDKEGENPKQIKVDSISITNPYEPGGFMDDDEDDSYRQVNVEHDGPWSIYTDSGFEKAISELVGFEVDFTEQGMQEDGMASMEGMMDDSIKSEAFANYKPNRFKDMPKGMNEEDKVEKEEETIEEAPTMDTTQLITLLKNAGLTEDQIKQRVDEWANTPAVGASEEGETSHGEPYENFAQSVNLSLKRYLDAEDFKVQGLKEHKVEDIKEAYKKSKKDKKDKK